MNEDSQSAETPEKEVAPQSTRWLIYTLAFVVLLFILFYSVKFFYNPKPETYTTPGGQVFTYQIGLWNTQLAKGDTLFNLHFHYHPGQTDNISIVGLFDDKNFNKGYVYLTFDPDGEDLQYVRLAMLEMSLNLVKALNVNPIIACTKNQTACENTPIINCSSKEPVIYLASEENAGVILNETCITLKGKENELIRATDKLLFHWFAIG